MEYMNYAEEKQEINIEDFFGTFPYFFDSNILIYFNKKDNQYYINYYNIITKNHKYFCCNSIIKMILLDNSKYPKVITCSKNGEVKLYNLLEKKISFTILFFDKNIIFRSMMKINQNKILLFENRNLFYIFNIKNKQIETKLKFTEDVFEFLRLILDDYKLNFSNRFDIKIKQEQIDIFEKLKIINTNNIEDRIVLKKIKETKKNKYDIVVNLYHFGKKGLEINEKKINFKSYFDMVDIPYFCYILKNGCFFFQLLKEEFHYAQKFCSIEFYNFNTEKLSHYEFPVASIKEKSKYNFYTFNKNENKIYMFKSNGEYKVIDQDSFYIKYKYLKK